MKTTKTRTSPNAAGKCFLILLMGLVASWFATSSLCSAQEAQFDWSVPEGFRYFSVELGIDDDGDGYDDNFNYLTDPRLYLSWMIFSTIMITRLML